MTPDLSQPAWRKSSYSGGEGGNCVEVANTLTAVRDSKNPSGAALTVALFEFLTDVKRGRFDR